MDSFAVSCDQLNGTLNCNVLNVSRKEALIAVQESIRVAQEANDSVCLQHALVSAVGL